MICVPAHIYSTHVRGNPHRSKASLTSGLTLLCPICDVRLSGETTWLQHVNGTQHHTKAQSQGKSPSVYPQYPAAVRSNFCLICKRVIVVQSWKAHLNSDTHRRLQRNALYRSNYEQAEQPQYGVVVSDEDGGLDLGVVTLEAAKNGVLRRLSVKLDTSAPSLTFVGVAIFSGTGTVSTSFSATASKVGRKLVAGSSASVTITFRQGIRGRAEGRLELTFKIRESQRTFIIARSLRAVVGNAADHELLRPSAPYVRRARAPWQHGRPVIEGERPPALDAVKWAVKLPPSLIPAALATILAEGSGRDVLNRVRSQFLPQFEPGTHGNYFRVLLWVEEARMVEDLHMYDIENTQFTKEGNLYSLPVPGLAEKRPSVVPGDTILAQVGNSDGRTHRGYVHIVVRDNIRVSFNSSFKIGARYVVRFQYNRTPIRRQHQALLAKCTSAQRLLFPGPEHAGLLNPILPTQHALTLFNPQIGSNASQLQAVKSILHLRPGSGPFIVYGPPGTGKTVTIVEGIRQTLRRTPGAHILACAPSNSAADLLAQRLSALDTSQLFRCNAVFRARASLPEDLVSYSFFRDNHFALPPVETLKSYKVIVTTCGNASFAYNVGIPNGHFSHIFIDEAGQGSEPEVLTAVKTIVAPGTHVILSGDPKQLGPVIRSSIARELNLGKSYLERLMEMPLYDEETGRGRSYVKLLKNFRSHRAILEYPNERFYGNELEVCGAPETINALLGSRTLVNRKWPVVFHHVSGENERESTSPSYFNIDEATEVLENIKGLLADRSHPVQGAEIGVITPYFAQVRKIRLLLRRENIEGVKVGSVEEFQGQERKVIIVSTVRSTRDLLSYDAKFTLGFVSNPRRFNVAVTRAQALLMVIGDASVLSIDPLWRAFMNYVYAHGGWRGDAPTWDTNAPVQMDGNYAAEIREAASADMEAFMARLEEGDDVEGQANVDLPFQEVE
ncbi:P-loop containing nucleoside triphosphate hydrolase protein [Trametes polyzona]|nr:P-loop containing nucleoside triphosphate hydrolase protein [Trametes polyzona]